MNTIKRKRFFIRGNFQIAFIAGFVLLLFMETLSASFFIYILSSRAIEETAFKSHIAINSLAEIVAPIIIKVNICAILISIFLSCVAASIVYFRLIVLFDKILEGLENLRNKAASFRLDVRGGKNAREFIMEFNHMTSYLDKRQAGLLDVLNSIIEEKELKNISKLHKKLDSIIDDENHT